MHSLKPNPLLSWLRLARVSALPSAIANILMGFLLAHDSWGPHRELLLLIASSCCLYTAGMILNDVFDFETDSIQRPSRPLPAGHISKRSAWIAGSLFLLTGVALAGVVSYETSRLQPDLLEQLAWRPLWIALALAVFILLYDGPLKKTALAPALMGGCRTLNVLLGASTISAARGLADPGAAPDSANSVLGFPLLVWFVAISIGIFVAGITQLAQQESSEEIKDKSHLKAGLVSILVGLVAIATVPFCPNSMIQPGSQLTKMYPLFIGVVGVTILRRVVIAVRDATPQTIQPAIIVSLRSLIVIDGALCFLFAPDRPIYAIFVMVLLAPTFTLGRIIRST